MAQPRVVLEKTYGAAKKIVAAGLEDFNRQRLGILNATGFAVTLRDGENIVGGCIADNMGDWLIIHLLWIDEKFRRRGHGRALLRAAEAEGKKRGARFAMVDSYSFQAPDFYKRESYETYGVVQGFPVAGESWVRMRKTL